MVVKRSTKDEGSEFWRSIKPIEPSTRLGAETEVFVPGSLDLSDERYFVPFSDTVFSRPLYINRNQNRWCDVLYAKEPGLVNRHYHPHQVFGFTLSGRWGYLEYDWIAERGDFLCETPGSSHTLISYESDEPMMVHFNVTGPLVWLDENGKHLETFDVFDYIDMCKAHYDKVGLGAHIIDGLTH